ncbi:MAG: hypothetical protein KAJ51_09205, partial [Thermoplasmata archaeon]|nr:hypothetical protein [Thermoplasmata archaeon]
MKIKFKSIIVISFVILSTLIFSLNFGFGVKIRGNELNNISTTISNNRLINGDYGWGLLAIISETIEDQNNNLDYSGEVKIAIEDDKIYVVWADGSNINGAGLDLDIFFRYFNGSEWSDIQIISEPILGYNKNTDSSWNPDIAVENGNIYVVWGDNNDTNGADTDWDIFYRCN